MKKSITPKYYVSTYDEFPIYEAAEGGYYYTGIELDDWVECNSLTAARKIMNNVVNSQNLEQYGYEKCGLDSWVKRSKYIGESEWICIEKQLGSQIKGQQTYC